jgi:SAM-dependent methyltransferase
MSGFGADWLALREPADARSRAASLVARWGAARTDRNPLDVVDLGCGTGANFRYLAPRLAPQQSWLLVDDDPDLLARAAPRTADWAASRGFAFDASAAGFAVGAGPSTWRARPGALDLAAQIGALEWPADALVTASALLDLVSIQWLATLVVCCRRSGADVLFALTYDGRVACEPAEAGDADVVDRINRHQHGDKGFGAALGPDAAAAVERLLIDAGYSVVTASSDWRLGAGERPLQRALIDGWRAAATEIAPDAADDVADWSRRRLAHVDAGRSRLEVGHVDVLGIAPRA